MEPSLFELSIYKSRINSHLSFLVCSRVCFLYSKYYIAQSFKGFVERSIANRHEKT